MAHSDAVPSRSLQLEGASNFRDLGGYRGLDGRALRWRRIFRSDHLARLSSADAQVLAGHGLGRVLDLRGAQERLAAPCTLPGVAVHSLAIEPSLFNRLHSRQQAGEALTPAVATKAMRETYREFVLANTPRFHSLFQHLLAGDAALVFHCTAGKDRTGLAAALVLPALGVSHDEVMHDYLLTNLHLKDRHAYAPGMPEDVLQLLNQVRAEFLGAAFEAINEQHGDVEAYLEGAMGLGSVQRQRLAALYLEG